MARRPRLLPPGAIYHVMSRGNRKNAIFDDEDDRAAFLRIVSDAARRFGVRFHEFCLMGNHYHLVCTTPRDNLSRVMQHVNGVYAKASNRRHRRTGHLFEAPFRSIVVDSEAYAQRLARYVVLNPVRAGFVSEPAAWAWSSYRASAGLESPPSFLDTSWIDWVFGGANRAEAQLKYRHFVNSADSEPEDIDSDALVIGTPAFEDALREFVDADRLSKQMPRAHRALGRPALREVFGIPSQSRAVRDRHIYEAHVRYGYTLAEVGRFLGLHPRTPSAILRRLERPTKR